MKKIILSLFFLSLLQQPLKSQNLPNPVELTRPDIMGLQFYDALAKLRNLEPAYQPSSARTSQEIAYFYYALATIFSFNGMYDSAILAIDKTYLRGVLRQGKRTTVDTTNFSRYRTVSAKSYIVERSAYTQAVMINEAHTVPRHRLFTKSLLQELYDKGYRVLCLEALAYSDEVSSPFYTGGGVGDYQEGKVQRLASGDRGYYTKESCFLDLLREANRIGYTIYGYEPEIDSSARDSLMAVNISKIFKKNPKAKVVIHAGHGHIRAGVKYKNLYFHFKEMTGITPLTIDQAAYYGHPNEYYNSPYYTALCKHFNPTEPVILTDSSGHHIHLSLDIDTTNVYIIAPYAGSAYGRSAWLFTQGGRKAVKVKNVSKPSIIKAYCATEVNINTINQPFYYRRSVPIDILSLENVNKGKDYYLALPDGVFLVRYEDLKGNVYNEYYEQVTL
ncbi:MAG: hypothetical protein LBK47_10385 [Prevotellaceae bacterium]|jgi:hypothetical protein|nr:hypothetical protein [Prevotellaceae bacterium]